MSSFYSKYKSSPEFKSKLAAIKIQGQKYMYKSYRKKRGIPSLNEISTRAIVKKEIKRSSEKKFFILSNAGYSILNTSTNAVLPYLINVTPFMLQGASTYQRIGNKVTVSKYKFNCRVASINQAASVSDYWSVKVFILRLKDGVASPVVADMTSFLYVDNNGTTQTTASWVSSNPGDSLLRVNNDYFTVYDSSPLMKIANANVDGFYNNDYSTECTWTTYLKKAPKILRFNQNNASLPTNVAFYLLACLTADTTTAGTEIPFITWNMEADYSDD